MEKLERLVGPGTAGLTQRVPQEYQISEGLYVVEYNNLIKCTQNQY